jgi:purine-nucleoside phosphorylase
MSNADGMNATVDALRETLGANAVSPRVLLVLGSGLGQFAESFENSTSAAFGEIPGFATAAVTGHKGRVVAGTLEGVNCIALQGRYHLYEGHDAALATLPIRAIAALGVETLIVTNAAGAVNRAFKPGDLMVIDDHINLMGRNPLVGAVVGNDLRFPDMTEAYSSVLRNLADDVAREENIPVVHGVYCAMLGPSYETPAEIRMIGRLGGDAVGMSTVPEVVVARARGLDVLGISLISNLATGISEQHLTHDEVMQAGVDAAESFERLVRGVLRRLRA